VFNYILRSGLATILVMTIVALFVFGLLFVAPGDPAARLIIAAPRVGSFERS
jgi:peptide/nickel transport system permease protein